MEGFSPFEASKNAYEVKVVRFNDKDPVITEVSSKDITK